ncbi:hypothetical protein EGM_08345, partial [Macaca fascicularis]
SNPSVGLNFGNLGSTATPATTSAPSSGFGTGLFGSKPATGFTLGGTNTGIATTITTGLTLVGTPATTSAATTGFSLGFNKPAASATPFALPIASTSASGLTLSSALTSTPAENSALSIEAGEAVLGDSSYLKSKAGERARESEGKMYSPENTPTERLGQNALGLTLGTTAATSTAGNEGLGGIDFSSSSDKKSDKTGTRPDFQSLKKFKTISFYPILCPGVFRNLLFFIKNFEIIQKSFRKVVTDLLMNFINDVLLKELLETVMAKGISKMLVSVQRLNIFFSVELKNAEIALRTQKTPPGLQHEYAAPADYFRILVQQFEVQLQQYRQQIEELENHLATQANNSHITPQVIDLSMAMQKIYQTFVALAAQLQSIHENVKVLKEQYLGYRKMFLGDAVDVFETRRAEAKKWQNTPRVTTGPTPFSTMPNAAAVAMAATLTQQQQPATAGPQPSLGVSFGTPFGSGIGTGLQSSGLGSSNLGGFGTSSGFGCSTTGASTFGFGTTNKPSGSLSAGFGSSSTSGFNFSNPGITASAGLTFGVSNPASAGFGTGGQLLQLKKPPAGNKRGKR